MRTRKEAVIAGRKQRRSRAEAVAEEAVEPQPTSLWGIVDPENSVLLPGKLDSLRRFLLLYSATRSCLWAVFAADLPQTGLALTTIWLFGCAAAAFLGGASSSATARSAASWAPAAALIALVPQLAWTLPFTNNHFILEMLVMIVLAVAGGSRRSDASRNAHVQARSDGDVRLAWRGVAWLTLIVFFHTGLQKVIYGYWFGGEFLAWMIGNTNRFGDLFMLFLSGGDILRLRAYNALSAGTGPYRVDSALFIAASNLVYIAEMALPVLLAWPRTRRLAAIASLVLVFVMQLGAREYGFAFLFLHLLMMFLPGDAIRRTLPLTAAIMAWVIGAAFKIFPGGWMVDPRSM
ncbi:MAG TPA: hypothetical protein VEL28_02230 [Candidatus Binatia bacterium]|nr:hypothetical protein [Candidatus Binatia bacterium]